MAKCQVSSKIFKINVLHDFCARVVRMGAKKCLKTDFLMLWEVCSEKRKVIRWKISIFGNQFVVKSCENIFV